MYRLVYSLPMCTAVWPSQSYGGFQCSWWGWTICTAGRKTIINPQTIDKGLKTSQAQRFLLSQLHLALLPQVQPIKLGEDAPAATSHWGRLQTHPITAEGAERSLLSTGRHGEGAQVCNALHCRYIQCVYVLPKNAHVCKQEVNGMNWWLRWVISNLLDGCLLAAFHTVKGPRTCRPWPTTASSHSLICCLIHSLLHSSFSAFHCGTSFTLCDYSAVQQRKGGVGEERTHACVLMWEREGG